MNEKIERFLLCQNPNTGQELYVCQGDALKVAGLMRRLGDWFISTKQ